MLSDKQGKHLAVLLSVGLCYILYLLANLFILQLPIAWLRSAVEIHPDPWELTLLSLLIVGDLLSIAWITVLATRTFKGQLSLRRFCLIAISSFLTFVIVGYVLTVVANLVLGMGWSVL